MAEQRASAASPADRRTAALVFGALFALGGALALFTLPLPHDPERDAWGVAVPAILALAMAVVLFAGRSRLPAAFVYAVPAFGSLLIGAVLLYGGATAVGAYAMLFYLVVIAITYFLPLWLAVVHSVVAMAVYAVSLALSDAALPQLYWTMAAGNVAISAFATFGLRRRVQGLVERLELAARTDPLTGLLNRRALQQRFADELARVDRSGAPLGLAVLDLDHFKEVNDRHGHAEGDRVLEHVSALLRAHARRVDSIARTGGEEFAVLAPYSNAEQTAELAERLRRAVKEEVSELAVPLTLSAGVAGYPDHGNTQERLLGAADAAMYEAKRLGRDRTVVASRRHGAAGERTGDGAAGDSAGDGAAGEGPGDGSSQEPRRPESSTK